MNLLSLSGARARTLGEDRAGLSTPSCALLSLIAGLGLLVGGCSSTAPATKDPTMPDRFPNHKTGQVRGQILQASDTLQSFSATARVAVRSPEQSGTFNAKVRQRRADSLFMQFSKFGFEGGRLLLTQDSVFFFDTREAVLRVGSVAAIQEIFPAPVSSDQFFQNMLGLIAPPPDRSWTLRADSSFYYLSSPSTNERYVVDPTRWRVVRYVKKGPNGTVRRKRLFSDFRRVEGVLMPHRVIFRRPADDLAAVVTYRQVNLNPPRRPLDLDVPPQVSRRPFR
jgi:hypothetical protein